MLITNKKQNAAFKATKMLKKFNRNKFKDAEYIAHKILKIDKNNIDALNIISLIYLAKNKITEAEEHVVQALKQTPTSIELNYSHALIYMQKRQYEQASKLFEFILDNDPNIHKARFYLANSFLTLGKYNQAISHYNCLINANQFTQSARANLFYCMKYSLPPQYSQDYETSVLSYLKFDSVNLASLSPFISTLIKLKYQLDSKNRTIELSDIANDVLLNESLRKLVFSNDYVEIFLTTLRCSLLSEYLTRKNIPDKILELAISIASQQFQNEHIYIAEQDELVAINSLISQVTDDLNQVSPNIEELIVPLIIIAMYFPLYDIEASTKLLQIELNLWPKFVQPLIKQCLFDIITEVKVASEIPTMGEIENTISKAVKQQYEINPYPRWSTLSYVPTKGYAKQLQSNLYQYSPPSHLYASPLKALIAGCGTGKHAITFAKDYPEAEVLALDLSRKSLAYAKIKADQYDASNIEFLNADILDLRLLNTKFNVIESIGVLHHMEDPDRGWKILTSLLVSNGIMKIGLYSRKARQPIIRAREIIKKEGIKSDHAGIKSFRIAALNDQYGQDIRKLANNSIDFFSLSGCRDLFFHVQEHQYTCDKLQQTLDKFDLKFLGFCNLNSVASSKYRECFPNDPSMNSLLNWSAVEEKVPHSFGEMYEFWCQLK